MVTEHSQGSQNSPQAPLKNPQVLCSSLREPFWSAQAFVLSSQVLFSSQQALFSSSLALFAKSQILVFSSPQSLPSSHKRCFRAQRGFLAPTGVVLETSGSAFERTGVVFEPRHDFRAHTGRYQTPSASEPAFWSPQAVFSRQ